MATQTDCEVSKRVTNTTEPWRISYSDTLLWKRLEGQAATSFRKRNPNKQLNRSGLTHSGICYQQRKRERQREKIQWSGRERGSECEDFSSQRSCFPGPVTDISTFLAKAEKAAEVKTCRVKKKKGFKHWNLMLHQKGRKEGIKRWKKKSIDTRRQRDTHI